MDATALVVDTLVALTIPCIAVVLFEGRRRRRRSVCQLHVADLFVVILLVSMISAWWKVTRDELTSQEVHRSAIEQRGHRVLGGGHGPIWIRRLSGVDLGLLPGVDEVEIEGSADDLSAILPHLESLRTLRAIRITDARQAAASNYPLSRLQSLKTLREIDLSYTAVDDSIIPEVVTLRSLERIDLEGTMVSTAGAARLSELLPQCKIILPAE